MEKVESMARGVIWRIIGTIIILAAFLIGSLIYVGFYAVDFRLEQKVIVVLVALILAVAGLAIMWVSFAGRRGWMPKFPAQYSRFYTWDTVWCVPSKCES